MSQIPLTTNIINVERSLFHRIRLECVDKGYLPNILSFVDDDNGRQAYTAQITAIKDNKGFAIEVFNNSSSQSKGLKKIPRIVLITKRSAPGAIGAGPERHYTLEEDGFFSVKNLPAQTTDFEFELRLVSNTTRQQRVLKAIIALALPKRGYIEDYENVDQKYFIKNTGQRLEPDNQSGILEDVYMYEVPDIYETEDVDPNSDGSVGKIIEINTNIETQTVAKSANNFDSNATSNSGNIDFTLIDNIISPPIQDPLTISDIQGLQTELDNLQDEIDNIGPGQSGIVLVDVVATENIAAYLPITSEGTIANSSTIAHRDKVIGIANAAASSGFLVVAVGFGEITNNLWSWNVGDKIFLSTGTLTNTPPTSGFVQLIGTATAADTIDVNIQASILI